MEIRGRSFKFVVGSDLDRDGMYYEAIEVSDSGSKFAAEVFYSDVTHEMTFTTIVPDIPIELVEHMLAQARKRLPMANRPSENWLSALQSIKGAV